MSASTSFSLFPFVYLLLLGDVLGVGLEVSPLVLLVHFARFEIGLMGSPFPIADPAAGMFPPVLGIAPILRGSFPRFRVLGDKREEVGILMIF